jgi:hypothetical protein
MPTLRTSIVVDGEIGRGQCHSGRRSTCISPSASDGSAGMEAIRWVVFGVLPGWGVDAAAIAGFILVSEDVFRGQVDCGVVPSLCGVLGHIDSCTVRSHAE